MVPRPPAAVYSLEIDFEGHLGRLQTDLSLGRHELPAGHPQVGQRKQRQHLRAVLGQAAITDLGVTKLALDHPEGMFHLRAHAGFAALPALVLSTVAGVLDGLHLTSFPGDQERRL